MLEVLQIQNPQQKREIFLKTFGESSSVQNTTWVVSDLTSKLAFQKELFKNQKMIPDETLLRAHELWLKLVQRMRGDYKIISMDAAQVILRKFLQTMDEPWMQRPGVAQLAHQYLQSLMPILSHQENFEAMGEFFKKNPEVYQKWGHWYVLCHKIYQHFLKEKLILSTWISSILVNETGFENIWNRNIIFDLGAQLQPIESELIQHLSKFLNITVLVPTPTFVSQYAKALKSYDSFLPKKTATDFKEEVNLNAHYAKYSTNLAEVQDLCFQIRQWIEKDKISANKIAVVAPDIGVYWPALREYLKTEGIPYQRPVTAPIKNFPEISSWLSQLKVESGNVSYADLELSLFSEDQFPQKFDDFQSQFANVYDVKDIQKLKKHFQLKKNDKEISLENFFEWAFQFWRESWNQEHLELLIAKAYAEMPANIPLKTKDWVELLEKLSAREVIVDEGFTDGIHCVDLISLKDLDVSHVHILGLTDKALRSMSAVLISEKDIAKLKQDYGFLVAEPERTELEFEVRWNLENKQNFYSLSYPQTDFDGQQLSPSVVWLTGAFAQNNFNEKIPMALPRASRWFQIQMEKATQAGPDEEVLSPWNLPERKLSLSASQIEDYLKCPFIWASKKLFRLNDLPDLDLDIDYQTRGKLLHKVAELLYKNHPSFQVSEAELDNLFEQAQQESEFKIFDADIWKSQKNRFKKMIQKFIEFELLWRNKFPALTTKYPETDFEIYLDPQTCDLRKSPKNGDIILRGRIDRIDVNEENNACVIIDYKFSMGDKSSFNSWLTKNELQLALYAMAIEKGALNNSYKVAGAIYYSFKELNRTKGFLSEDYNGHFYEMSPRSSAKINEIKKQELYTEVQKKISEVVGNMQKNEFNPKPHDITKCPDCYWRNLCRAPHLQ